MRVRAGRLSLLSLGLLATAFPLPAVASAAAPTSGLVLPSQTCRGIFILPVTLDGTTLELLLDTGSSWTFLDPAAVRRVRGGEVSGRKVAFASAVIGEHSLGGLRARVYPLDILDRALGRPIDGILGFPAFKDVLLTLDYPASQVRVSSGSLPRPDGREIFRDTGWKRPFLQARVGREKLELQLDSGATPGHLQLELKDRVEWSVAPRPAITKVVFGGVVVDAGGRLKGDLGLGPLEFETPVAFLAGRERQVGWQILRHFTWTFDQKKKRIRIERQSAESHSIGGAITTPSFVSRGIGIRPRPEGLEVVRVFTGTPAAAVGLREGDLIVAIDGTPVYERPCASPHGEPEGTRLRLSYLRDGAAAEVEIRMVALIP